MRTHALIHSCLVLATTYAAYGLTIPLERSTTDPSIVSDPGHSGPDCANVTIPTTNSTGVDLSIKAAKAAKPKPKTTPKKTTPKTTPKKTTSTSSKTTSVAKTTSTSKPATTSTTTSLAKPTTTSKPATTSKTTSLAKPTTTSKPATTSKTTPVAKPTTTAKTSSLAKTTAKTTLATSSKPASTSSAATDSGVGSTSTRASRSLALPTSLLTSAAGAATSLLGGDGGATATSSGSGVVETVNPFIPVAELAVDATSPADGSLDGPDNLRLRLIVPAPPTDEMPALVNATVTLNGREWYITELFKTPDNAATFPNYTAISYRWYDGRLPNPFFDGFLMSNLTLPSLASAMRNSNQEAFWIDCFSIPATNPLKGVILDLLSNIFSAAHEVVVPLGLKDRDTMAFLTNGTDPTTLPETTLQTVMSDLNQEEWVNSIWTYKESLSAKTYTFTDRDFTSYNETSDVTEPSAKETKFFDKISSLSQAYMTTMGLNDFDMRLQMRNVDALVELGLDRTLNAAYERSVFTSMASLDRRFVESDGNFFWGLYGAVTEALIPADKPHATLAEKYDRFFEVCEEKNDYSFIYTSTARRNTTGRTFYPKSANLDSILNWPTSPAFQTANVTADGSLKLDGMVSLPKADALGTVGQNFIEDWFSTNVPNITANGTDASVAEKVYQIIQKMDFKGSDQYILTNDGIFFPQQEVPTTNATVIVTSQLGWSFGAPGLARFTLDNGTNYLPGAFVGSVVKSKAKSIVMA